MPKARPEAGWGAMWYWFHKPDHHAVRFPYAGNTAPPAYLPHLSIASKSRRLTRRRQEATGVGAQMRERLRAPHWRCKSPVVLYPSKTFPNSFEIRPIKVYLVIKFSILPPFTLVTDSTVLFSVTYTSKNSDITQNIIFFFFCPVSHYIARK